jgi:hypothetical protein
MSIHSPSLHPGVNQTLGLRAWSNDNGKSITYFVNGDNIYSHPSNDQISRRHILTSLMIEQQVRPVDLEQSLDLKHRTLMNWLKQWREFGPASFFASENPRKAPVMSAEIIAECEKRLATGMSSSAVARQLGIGVSVLSKARLQGRVKSPAASAPPQSNAASPSAGDDDKAPEPPPVKPRDRSDRNRSDAATANGGLGTACQNADARILAAMGLSDGIVTRFQAANAVQCGGLLSTLPSLFSCGLFDIPNFTSLSPGYYRISHLLLTLGFMALGRLKRPEHLRHFPPGEFGLSLGIDRCPEVTTVRDKIHEMASNADLDGLGKFLHRKWAEAEPDLAGYLYIDGHTRPYHGKLANLPPRYVSRDRLCLPGTTDYWVGDALGKPFFVVSKPINPGLSEAIISDVVPRLLEDVPGQPSQAQLDANPLLHRFIIVFDREGSHYALIEELWTKYRIAAITYRKNVKDKWEEADFVDTQVKSPGGEITSMRLASRTTEITQGKNSLTVLEVRRLNDGGHQTVMITTARTLMPSRIAGQMFSRWCQENLFKYLMEHYDIDGLIEFGSEAIPSTVTIPNSDRKQIAKEISLIKTNQGKIVRKQVFVDDLTEAAMTKQAKLLESWQDLEAQRHALMEYRRTLPKHIALADLPEDQRPTQLKPLSKRLTDIIKMIAYRAETQLVNLLRAHYKAEELKTEDESRALIRQLMISTADILPCPEEKKLLVKIHNPALPCHARALETLLKNLTALKFRHPETDELICYELLAPAPPATP